MNGDNGDGVERWDTAPRTFRIEPVARPRAPLALTPVTPARSRRY
ncbi:hypothetical protein ACFWIA_08660 [Streptomyces sp. NPDC127068]